MTLIVGIKCQDAIVMGADSAATSSTSTGQRTSMQPVPKLDLISDSIVLGVSGPVGLAQYFKAEIANLWSNKDLSGKTQVECSKILREAIWKNLQREYEIAAQASQTIGQSAINDILTQTLVAIPVNKEPCLFEFTIKGCPEIKTEKIPTVAIGSGQQTADPFLCFLRRVLWPNRLPTIGEGILAAYWALDYSIKSAPGGIGGPIRISVLEKVKDRCQCRELTETDINNYEEWLGSIESEIKSCIDLIFTQGPDKILEPPEPKVESKETTKDTV